MSEFAPVLIPVLTEYDNLLSKPPFLKKKSNFTSVFIFIQNLKDFSLKGSSRADPLLFYFFWKTTISLKYI